MCLKSCFSFKANRSPSSWLRPGPEGRIPFLVSTFEGGGARDRPAGLLACAHPPPPVAPSACARHPGSGWTRCWPALECHNTFLMRAPLGAAEVLGGSSSSSAHGSARSQAGDEMGACDWTGSRMSRLFLLPLHQEHGPHGGQVPLWEGRPQHGACSRPVAAGVRSFQRLTEQPHLVS